MRRSFFAAAPRVPGEGARAAVFPTFGAPAPAPVPGRDEITRLLLDFSGGDASARERLLPAIYGELQRIAHGALGREFGGHTLSATELVHEAYLRLVDVRRVAWQDRAHFFAVAARVMRRVLVDWARARRAEKRGGDLAAVTLTDELGAPTRADELVVLDEALDRLAARSARQARVVECRYFAGLSIEETAEVLGVSPTTVKQDWLVARTWLFREMRRDLSP